MFLLLGASSGQAVNKCLLPGTLNVLPAGDMGGEIKVQIPGLYQSFYPLSSGHIMRSLSSLNS